MKRNPLMLAAAFLLAPMVVTSSAQAQLITNGFTFSVASGADRNVGTHFHSSTGGDFGNPAGKAEVGAFATEEVRGLSEYDLATLANSPTAFVTFEVFKAGGLFDGTNDFPFTGNINVFAYQANNNEDISDYEIATLGSVGSFSTAGLLVGNTLSFDIAAIFNNAIDNGWSSLGMRLQVEDWNDTQGGAWTFDNFRLTTDNLTTAVPEPSTYAMLLVGLVGIGLAARRRRHSEIV